MIILTINNHNNNKYNTYNKQNTYKGKTNNNTYLLYPNYEETTWSNMRHKHHAHYQKHHAHYVHIHYLYNSKYDLTKDMYGIRIAQLNKVRKRHIWEFHKRLILYSILY